MMNTLLLFLLSFGSIFPTESCDQSYQEFLKAYQEIGMYQDGQAYELELQITSHFDKAISGQKVTTQRLLSYIHDDGYFMQSDELINAGSNGFMTTIIPRAKTIVTARYDQSQLPDMTQAMEKYAQLFQSNSSHTCEEVNMKGSTIKKFHIQFDEPQSIQQQYIEAATFYVSASDKVLKTEFEYIVSQNLQKQTIEYIKTNDAFPINRVPSYNFPFEENGMLKKEFSGYQVINNE